MNHHRPLTQADLDVLDHPIGGSWYLEPPRPPLWRRAWALLVMLRVKAAGMGERVAFGLCLLIAVVGLIAVAAKHIEAEREAAAVEALQQEQR